MSTEHTNNTHENGVHEAESGACEFEIRYLPDDIDPISQSYSEALGDMRIHDPLSHLLADLIDVPNFEAMALAIIREPQLHDHFMLYGLMSQPYDFSANGNSATVNGDHLRVMDAFEDFDEALYAAGSSTQTGLSFLSLDPRDSQGCPVRLREQILAPDILTNALPTGTLRRLTFAPRVR